MNKIHQCAVIGVRALPSCRPSVAPQALILGKTHPKLLIRSFTFQIRSLLYAPNVKKSLRSLGKVLVKFWKRPTPGL
jgi:hypothetical protein